MLYMLDTDTSSYIIKRHPLSLLETLHAKAEAGHDLNHIVHAEHFAKSRAFLFSKGMH